MIPETNDTRAYYYYGDGRPVIAWNDDGDALIAAEDGRLVVAREQPGFDGTFGPYDLRPCPFPDETDGAGS